MPNLSHRQGRKSFAYTSGPPGQWKLDQRTANHRRILSARGKAGIARRRFVVHHRVEKVLLDLERLHLPLCQPWANNRRVEEVNESRMAALWEKVDCSWSRMKESCMNSILISFFSLYWSNSLLFCNQLFFLFLFEKTLKHCFRKKWYTWKIPEYYSLKIEFPKNIFLIFNFFDMF